MSGLLVGDVGGTNVRFAMGVQRDSGIHVETFRKYPGDSFTDFYEAVDHYLTETGLQPSSALFALAGPPVARSVTLTNRPWTISAEMLESKFHISRVDLINDFSAMARAVPELPDDAFDHIKPGQAVSGFPVAVTGPGTGLGVATLTGRAGRDWQVISGEGGHSAYAARTDLEWQVVKRLQARFGFISNELICAGIGLEPVHRALCEINGVSFETMSPAAVLAAAAEGDAVCQTICRLRADAVMGVAGDVALINGARGGVILAGGVAQRLSAYLNRPESLARFTDRAALAEYMAAIPIRLLRQESAPLIGAAAWHFSVSN